MARGMFALAVPKEFFATAGIGAHFADHREDILLELRVIPQHHAEGVRGDVRHLNQAAFARGKLLPRIIGSTFSPEVVSSSSMTRIA